VSLAGRIAILEILKSYTVRFVAFPSAAKRRKSAEIPGVSHDTELLRYLGKCLHTTTIRKQLYSGKCSRLDIIFYILSTVLSSTAHCGTCQLTVKKDEGFVKHQGKWSTAGAAAADSAVGALVAAVSTVPVTKERLVTWDNPLLFFW
jgi:putative lipase involved disintegration of autophagic bodies